MTPAQAASLSRAVAQYAHRDPAREARRLMALGIDPQRAIGTVAGTTLLAIAAQIETRAAAAPAARKEASA
jgi:hypothetical protein